MSIADLAGLDLLQDPQAVPEWRDASAAPRGTAQSQPPPRARTVEEKLEMVAGELGVVILPTSTAQFYTRPDVTYRPVEDLAPNQVALAYQVGRVSVELRAVEEIVRERYLESARR